MGASYTLYGSDGSGSAAVEVALDWTGVRWARIDAASWEPGPGLEALKGVNPLGQIPTLLLPDGSVMTESAAILIHLGLVHPRSGLLPADAAARARALRGLVYVAANCYAAIGVVDFPGRWLAGRPRQATRDRLHQGSRERLHALWDAFADQFVGGDPFLGGAAPDALDLLAAVVSKWSGTRQHLATSRPAFSKLLKRVEAHPRVAPVLDRHWPRRR
ncbi:glutathione S-transferase [uncultured Methylibium sp.]|uniref:glutathione S-transferase n=1 Tax=uncultured Methylibium sp. TaxID=381093 RepID=UPI0025F2788F|nr:glutathione S-transferase [uncultured Methylibium sp.]